MLCGTDKDGTEDSKLDDALRFFQQHDYFKVVMPRNTSNDRLVNHIFSGGAMIAAYQETKGLKEWHYALFIQGEYGKWTVINHSTGKDLYTEYDIDPDKMCARLDKSSLWLITKSNRSE
jgi:hypothetical protein